MAQEAGRWLERQGLLLNPSLLDQLLPFALVLQGTQICHAGPSLCRCLEPADLTHHQLDAVLQLLEPEQHLALSEAHFAALLDRPLRLAERSETSAGPAPRQFSGQLLSLQRGFWLLVLAPLPETLDELHRYGLTLQDLPLHDPFRQTFVDRLMSAGIQELLAIERRRSEQEPAAAGGIEDLLNLLNEPGSDQVDPD